MDIINNEKKPISTKNYLKSLLIFILVLILLPSVILVIILISKIKNEVYRNRLKNFKPTIFISDISTDEIVNQIRSQFEISEDMRCTHAWGCEEKIYVLAKKGSSFLPSGIIITDENSKVPVLSSNLSKTSSIDCEPQAKESLINIYNNFDIYVSQKTPWPFDAPSFFDRKYGNILYVKNGNKQYGINNIPNGLLNCGFTIE
ncbi:hypothetical protein HY030_00430 [Candidatus Gottesmanbacteria bacterium]|nr:hypothetical protein [Candidatus Gottesmanbacteria bacterium]